MGSLHSNTAFLTTTLPVASFLLSVSARSRCPRGTFGPPTCSGRCNCRWNLACDRVDGSCEYGCIEGWRGTGCDIRVCRTNYFSPPLCNKRCRCRNPSKCHPITGGCPVNGCMEGWWGPNCWEKVDNRKECRVGDKNCTLSVWDICFCSDPNCKLPKGKCRKGCPRGLMGPNCKVRACPEGYYRPPDCKKKCHCKDDEFCSAHDGNCQGTECTPGRQGPTCSQFMCPVTTFGAPHCQSKCFCALNEYGVSTHCDVDSGSCDAGCMEGWKGPQCNTRLCPSGSYGYPECSNECTCRNNQVCNSLTGACDGLLYSELQHSTPKPESAGPLNSVLSSVIFTIAISAIAVITCIGVFIVSLTKTSDPSVDGSAAGHEPQRKDKISEGCSPLSIESPDSETAV